jgi:hypothetical protein
MHANYLCLSNLLSMMIFISKLAASVSIITSIYLKYNAQKELQTYKYTYYNIVPWRIFNNKKNIYIKNMMNVNYRLFSFNSISINFLFQIHFLSF